MIQRLCLWAFISTRGWQWTEPNIWLFGEQNTSSYTQYPIHINHCQIICWTKSQFVRHKRLKSCHSSHTFKLLWFNTISRNYMRIHAIHIHKWINKTEEPIVYSYFLLLRRIPRTERGPESLNWSNTTQ